jgi:hypoxanthine phosphoribosyltransferase
MDLQQVEKDVDLEQILITEDEILTCLRNMAKEIEADYQGKDILLVGVLKGAVMVMADLARSFDRHIEMDWMAISSYGSGTKSSGVVRILKDLDTDIAERHVLIVEDIIDTGLTLSWLVANLQSRGPAASTSPIHSSSDTASTTPRSTATCAASRPSPRPPTTDPPVTVRLLTRTAFYAFYYGECQ